MILSPGFIYWDGREWEDNDVYIKYYEKKMPLGCFYMENIFATDDLTDATTVFLLSVWSLPHVQNQELDCFMQQHAVSAWSDRKEMQFSSKRIHNKKW